MVNRPSVDADDAAVARYVQEWVEYAAREGFGAALALLDENPHLQWSEELFDQLTHDHFDDGASCRVTAAAGVQGVRVDVVRYDDGSGFAVDHDLPLNGKLSDFTAQFDIRRHWDRLSIVLEDIHVL